jgi:hypothetical protein
MNSKINITDLKEMMPNSRSFYISPEMNERINNSKAYFQSRGAFFRTISALYFANQKRIDYPNYKKSKRFSVKLSLTLIKQINHAKKEYNCKGNDIGRMILFYFFEEIDFVKKNIAQNDLTPVQISKILMSKKRT